MQIEAGDTDKIQELDIFIYRLYDVKYNDFIKITQHIDIDETKFISIKI